MYQQSVLISITQLLLLEWLHCAQAAGTPCKIANNRLDPNSHKFLSDCGPTEYCAAALPIDATVQPKNTTLTEEIEDLARMHLVQLAHHGMAGQSTLHGKGIAKRGEQSIFLPAKEGNSTTALPGNSTETCQPKGCRRDEFPFGYGQFDILPPRCALDQFCPDEEDECRPLIEVGGACQLNRDGECRSATPRSAM